MCQTIKSNKKKYIKFINGAAYLISCSCIIECCAFIGVVLLPGTSRVLNMNTFFCIYVVYFCIYVIYIRQNGLTESGWNSP